MDTYDLRLSWPTAGTSFAFERNFPSIDAARERAMKLLRDWSLVRPVLPIATISYAPTGAPVLRIDRISDD